HVDPVAGRVTLAYDAGGRRISKTTSSQTRKFIYDYEKVLQETDGGNVQTREYTSTDELYGNLLSGYDHGQSLCFEFDGLGSTDALVNDSEFSTDRYTYRAFGLETHTGTSGAAMGANLPNPLPMMLGSVGGAASPSTELTFVGQQGYVHDLELELYFARGRYY